MARTHSITQILSLALTLAVLTLSSGCFTPPFAPENDEPVQTDQQPPVIENPTLHADLNSDGVVDASDVAYFASALAADLNRDGQVDDADQAHLESVLGEIVQDPSLLDASGLARYARIVVADLNRDGIVDAADIGAFARLLQMAERADLSRDGFLNDEDLKLIEQSLGASVVTSIATS